MKSRSMGGRVPIKNWWTRSAKVTVIWFTCVLAFYCLFRMALHNSSPYNDSNGETNLAGISRSNTEKRSILYARMAKDLDENGAAFVRKGETSQSLSLSDIFILKDGVVTPVLRAADPPVRANVLHLGTEYSVPISRSVKRILMPYFDKAIWFQNSSVYHFSMFHASHHIYPVRVTEAEIEAEARAVKAVSECLCPLDIVLDRVVLTSSGVILGCWQVVSGSDPVNIRAKLRSVLPNAPEKQLYDEVMLHTSFARLLGHPNISSEEGNKISELQIYHELVDKLNKEIRGMKARVSELWYVEEYDLLALALNGRMKIRNFTLNCSTP